MHVARLGFHVIIIIVADQDKGELRTEDNLSSTHQFMATTTHLMPKIF